MTRASALARLDEAKRYLDETLRAMPVPADRDFTFTEAAKRKAAWRGYFIAQAAVRKIERARLAETMGV